MALNLNYAKFRAALFEDLEAVKAHLMFGAPDPGTQAKERLEAEGWSILDVPPASGGVRVFMAIAPDQELVLVEIHADDVQ